MFSTDQLYIELYLVTHIYQLNLKKLYLQSCEHEYEALLNHITTLVTDIHDTYSINEMNVLTFSIWWISVHFNILYFIYPITSVRCIQLIFHPVPP